MPVWITFAQTPNGMAFGVGCTICDCCGDMGRCQLWICPQNIVFARAGGKRGSDIFDGNACADEYRHATHYLRVAVDELGV